MARNALGQILFFLVLLFSICHSEPIQQDASSQTAQENEVLSSNPIHRQFWQLFGHASMQYWKSVHGKTLICVALMEQAARPQTDATERERIRSFVLNSCGDRPLNSQNAAAEDGEDAQSSLDAADLDRYYV